MHAIEEQKLKKKIVLDQIYYGRIRSEKAFIQLTINANRNFSKFLCCK